MHSPDHHVPDTHGRAGLQDLPHKDQRAFRTFAAKALLGGEFDPHEGFELIRQDNGFQCIGKDILGRLFQHGGFEGGVPPVALIFLIQMRHFQRDRAGIDVTKAGYDLAYRKDAGFTSQYDLYFLPGYLGQSFAGAGQLPVVRHGVGQRIKARFQMAKASDGRQIAFDLRPDGRHLGARGLHFGEIC